MAKVTVDGPNKLFRVISGVTNIDVGGELYSEWKRWASQADNVKYLAAFRTLGGDATNPEETQFAPRYYFLMNGWRVHVDGEQVVVQTNLYTEEGDSPFIVINNGAVTNRASDVPIIKSEIDKVLDYRGQVHVDIDNGFPGTEHPVGTLAKPSNNLTEAKVIAIGINSYAFVLLSNLVLSEDVDGYAFYGGAARSTLDLNSMSTHGCRFIECDILGAQNSPYNIYEKCRINAITDFAGAMVSCYFMTATPITLRSFIPIMMTDCRSAIAGTTSPTFDFSAGNIDLSVRAYSGGFRVLNSVAASNVVTLEYIAGRFNLDNTTNTAGDYNLRGNVDCDGIETPLQPDVHILRNGALCRRGIAEAVWDYERL